jgi:hypothetical protein
MKTLLFLQLVIVVLAVRANNFSIYNILMIKIYVASLELQYLFDHRLVSNCLLVFMYCLLTWTIQIIIFLLNMFDL